MHSQGSIKIFMFVVAVGVVVRLAAVGFLAAVRHDVVELPDEVQYWNMARSLAGGEGLRDELGFQATRMPLYPGFLALFVKFENGRVLAQGAQAFLSALACGFVSMLVLQIAPPSSRKLAAVVAGLLVALDPFLIYFSRLLLTESLFTCALCGLLAVSWQTSQKEARSGWLRWLASGGLCTLCVYLRPSSLGFVVCWTLFLLLRRRFDQAGLVGVCGGWLILLLSLSPWAARNRSVIGEGVWLTTRLGISLYDGAGPQATGASNLGGIKHTAQDEIGWNRHFKTEAWKHIRERPDRILRLAGRKLLRTWNPWPNAEDFQNVWIKVALGSWTIFILAAAVCGVRSMPRSTTTIIGLLLPAFYFTALHLLFVGSVRYRLPAMPMIEILSAVGITSLLTDFSAARSSPRRAPHEK